MNRHWRLFVTVSTIFVLLLTGGCAKGDDSSSGNTVPNSQEVPMDAAASEEQIAREVADLDEYFSKYNLELTDFSIIKRQTNNDQKTDYVWITVFGSTDSFDYISEYSLTYRKYNSGWLLDESTQDNFSFFAKAEPESVQTERTLLEKYNTVSFVKAGEESDPNQRTYYYTGTIEKDLVTKQYDITVKYEFSPENGWEITKESEKEQTYTFDIVGEWLFQDDSHIYYIHVSDVDGSEITCEYAFYNKLLPDNDELWSLRFSELKTYSIQSKLTLGDVHRIDAGWMNEGEKAQAYSAPSLEDDVIWFYNGGFVVNQHHLQRISESTNVQNYPDELKDVVNNYIVDYSQIPKSLFDETLIGYIKCLGLTYEELGLDQSNSISNLGNKYELSNAMFLGRPASVNIFVEPEPNALPTNLQIELNGSSYSDIRNSIKQIPGLNFYYESETYMVAIVPNTDFYIQIYDSFGHLNIWIYPLK